MNRAFLLEPLRPRSANRFRRPHATPLDTLAGMPYYRLMMGTRMIRHYQNWYRFSFTPPALLVGRSVLFR